MSELEKARKKVSDNIAKLKAKGVIQKNIASLIKRISNGKTSISQSTISKSKKEENLKKIKNVIKQTDFLIEYISKHPEILEVDLNKNEKEVLEDEIVTWSGVVDKFVSKELKRFNSLNSENEMIVIEAIGMKLNSLLNVLQSFYKNKILPVCHLKCVLIDPDETGMKYRGIIEGERAEYEIKIKGGFLFWKAFRNTLLKDDVLCDSKIDIRLLKPDPNFYMIKILDKILVSVYLRDIGNTSYYEIIDENKEPKKFQDYYNFYLQYYINDKLSSTLDWKHKIFSS